MICSVRTEREVHFVRDAIVMQNDIGHRKTVVSFYIFWNWIIERYYFEIFYIRREADVDFVYQCLCT